MIDVLTIDKIKEQLLQNNSKENIEQLLTWLAREIKIQTIIQQVLFRMKYHSEIDISNVKKLLTLEEVELIINHYSNFYPEPLDKFKAKVYDYVETIRQFQIDYSRFKK